MSLTQTQVATDHHLPSSDDYVSVTVSQLKVGARLQQPLYDARTGNEQLLLAAGKQLIPSYIENLESRGIQSVMIHKVDLERIISDETRREVKRARPLRIAANGSIKPPEIKATPSWAGWRFESDSFVHLLKTPTQIQRDPVRIHQFEASYNSRVSTVDGLLQSLVQSRKFHLDVAFDVCQGQLKEVIEDLDEFLQRGTLPITADYPSRHSLQTAMLAMSMAVIMGYCENDIIELGIGCLMHDAGMLMVPPQLIEAGHKISQTERLEVQKHPIHAANMLQECRDFPQKSRHVVYQMHERMNGSGYPRGRVGTQIHPLARIAAVADSFLALISPRPSRKALQPYQAVERILMSARQGLYDPGVVRALLHTVSLFPLGSHVQLSDGRVARIVRSHREDFAQPVVEIVDPVGSQRPVVIDLRNESRLSIRNSLAMSDEATPVASSSPAELIAAAASL